MADPPPNSSDPTVVPATKAKKKKAPQGTKKPRSELTPEEIAKLDAESAKRRNRRGEAIELAAVEAARQKADAQEKEDIVGKAKCQHRCQRSRTPSMASSPRMLSSRVMARPFKWVGRAFQSLEAFKARHNDKPFTLTHCWQIINNCPKFKDQYRELQRKTAKKEAALVGGGDGEALKRPRGNTNSKVDDKRDATSYALHETLHGMMSQKEVTDEKKRQGKEEQMKQYMELQTKKLEMEEAAKKRKIDMEEAARQRQLDIEAANAAASQRQLDIEATNAARKAKEVALAIMSVDLSKINGKTRSWFEARQKEMFEPMA
ncbi:Serine/threonine-protein kinase mph1 [Hordeum vulgare]|nr:Serine/threonine-protein kinase mph1 [Hordeum vulgare]